jgi:hypothetical protein
VAGSNLTPASVFAVPTCSQSRIESPRDPVTIPLAAAGRTTIHRLPSGIVMPQVDSSHTAVTMAKDVVNRVSTGCQMRMAIPATGLEVGAFGPLVPRVDEHQPVTGGIGP